VATALCVYLGLRLRAIYYLSGWDGVERPLFRPLATIGTADDMVGDFPTAQEKGSFFASKTRPRPSCFLLW
jgi:hypothetical protein